MSISDIGSRRPRTVTGHSTEDMTGLIMEDIAHNTARPSDTQRRQDTDDNAYIGKHDSKSSMVNGLFIRHGHSSVSLGDRRRIGFIIAGCSMAFIAVIFAGMKAVDSHYEGTALPGVSIGSTIVQGKASGDIATVIKGIDKNIKVTVSSNGMKSTKPLTDYGVTIDEKATSDKAIAAKRDKPIWARVNPFSKTTVTPVYKLDTTKFDSTVYAMSGHDAPVDATVSYDQNSGRFVTTEGHDGMSTDMKSVRNAVKSAVEGLSTTSVNAAWVKAEPTVSNETASLMAGKANEILDKSSVTVSNGTWNVSLERSELAGMLSFHDGKVSVDESKVSEWAQGLKSSLGRDMKPQITMVRPDSSKGRIAVVQYGKDGIGVNDTSPASKAVRDAVEGLTHVDATVSTSTVSMEKKEQPAPSNFNVENGDPWLKVDLTAEKAYAYKGTTLVREFNVATGKPGTATDPGVFYVDTKYRTQTMRGPGYVTPNVPWISYFNGGEGFHGAPWNTWNISRGVSSSHGCVNMNVADAKWVYDFAPIGTKVEVVGTTHSGASR